MEGQRQCQPRGQCDQSQHSFHSHRRILIKSEEYDPGSRIREIQGFLGASSRGRARILTTTFVPGGGARVVSKKTVGFGS